MPFSSSQGAACCNGFLQIDGEIRTLYTVTLSCTMQAVANQYHGEHCYTYSQDHCAQRGFFGRHQIKLLQLYILFVQIPVESFALIGRSFIPLQKQGKAILTDGMLTDVGSDVMRHYNKGCTQPAN